jgi:hypothetical protein
MNKEEMMSQYYINEPENNYREAQKRIKEAMEKGELYVYLPGKNSRSDFSWCATYETIDRLRDDGFDIDVVWEPWEYWSVEWGYK